MKQYFYFSINFDKLTKDILSRWIEGTTGRKYINLYNSIDKNFIAFGNEHTVFRLPASLFPFDYEKLLTTQNIRDFRNMVTDKFFDYATLRPQLTQVAIKSLDTVKSGAHFVILGNDNFDIAIDKKYFDYVNINNATFFAKSPTEPLYITRGEEIDGIILPVKIND